MNSAQLRPWGGSACTSSLLAMHKSLSPARLVRQPSPSRPLFSPLQRHEEPKAGGQPGDDWEQGTYVYFDSTLHDDAGG